MRARVRACQHTKVFAAMCCILQVPATARRQRADAAIPMPAVRDWRVVGVCVVEADQTPFRPPGSRCARAGAMRASPGSSPAPRQHHGERGPLASSLIGARPCAAHRPAGHGTVHLKTSAPFIYFKILNGRIQNQKSTGPLVNVIRITLFE